MRVVGDERRFVQAGGNTAPRSVAGQRSARRDEAQENEVGSPPLSDVSALIVLPYRGLNILSAVLPRNPSQMNLLIQMED